jgi:hypothetical protein
VTLEDVVRGGRVSAETILRFGLRDVLEGCTESPAHLVVLAATAGPDGRPGVVVWGVPPHGDLPAALQYSPDVQTWRPVRGDGAADDSPPLRYTGWITADPPRPIDLERPKQLQGWRIVDEYDQGWLVPVARAVDNPRGGLPWGVSWDAQDRPEIGVVGRHARFWERSARLDDMVRERGSEARNGMLILGEGLSEAEDHFVLEMVVEALALNYRVDRSVLAAYDQARPGWMSQVVCSLMANAIVDMAGKRLWEAAKKKTVTRPGRGGVSSTPGEADAIQATGPAGESCW